MSPELRNQRTQIIRGGLTTPGQGPPAWIPNWIDYRASLANVDRRLKRGEAVAECAHCECETDISPVPHSPICKALAVVEPEGLDLLERLDAGVPLGEADAERLGPDGSASLNGTNRYGLKRNGRGYTWPRDTIIRALRDFAAEHGRAPSMADAKKSPVDVLPGAITVAREFGSWVAAIAAAGLEVRSAGRPPAAATAERDKTADEAEQPSPPVVPVADQPVRAGETLSRSAPPHLAALIAAARAFADTLERELAE